jgi:hypothetical protein
MRALYRCMERGAVHAQGAGASGADLEYHVERSLDPEGFRFHERRDGEDDTPAPFARTAGEILSLLEDSLTIALQLQRPDLLFVHAAALAGDQGAVVIVGPSGAGKSTLAWALAGHSYRYLSDELAPFDVERLQVVPFARAIHLKVPPPGALTLPPDIVETHTNLCVPAASLPGGFADAPTSLDALCFLAPEPRPAKPQIRELSTGTAVSRLFSNTLNALAHPHYGVDATIRLARNARCYELAAADLEATCKLVKSVI